MNTDFTDEELSEQININEDEARRLLNDEDRMETFLKRLERKMSRIPKVGKALSDIPMLISLVRAYIRKEYTEIPMGAMVAIVGALIYILNPLDLIPDVIPLIGQLDDAAVLLFAMRLVGDDVDEYREWLKKRERKEIQ